MLANAPVEQKLREGRHHHPRGSRELVQEENSLVALGPEPGARKLGDLAVSRDLVNQKRETMTVYTVHD